MPGNHSAAYSRNRLCRRGHSHYGNSVRPQLEPHCRGIGILSPHLLSTPSVLLQHTSCPLISPGPYSRSFLPDQKAAISSWVGIVSGRLGTPRRRRGRPCSTRLQQIRWNVRRSETLDTPRSGSMRCAQCAWFQTLAAIPTDKGLDILPSNPESEKLKSGSLLTGNGPTKVVP